MEDQSNVLEWEVYSSSGLATVSHTASFDRPASGVKLSDHIFVIGGYDSVSGLGKLELLFLNRQVPHSITQIDAISYSDVIPFELAWSKEQEKLYIWDSFGPLFAAPFTEDSGLPARAAFSAPLAPVTLPALHDPTRLIYKMWARPTGVNFTPTTLRHRKGTSDFPRYIVIHDGQNGWATQAWSTRDVSDLAIEGAGYAIRSAGYVPVLGPVLIKGSGGPFHVVDVDSGQNVFSSTLPALFEWWKSDDDDTTTWNSVTFPPGALRTDGHYLVRHALTQQESRTFLPLIRYGEVVPVDVGGVTWWMQKGRANGWEAFLGNTKFRVSGQLGVNPAMGSQVHHYLLVGFRRPDATDPVLQSGQQYVLSEVAATLGPTVVPSFDALTTEQRVEACRRWCLSLEAPHSNKPDRLPTGIIQQLVIQAATSR